MNYISKTRFPEPLLEYYKSYNSDDKKILRKLFSKDESVRQAFLTWSANHQSIVDNVPRFSKAKKIAGKIKLKNSLPEPANIDNSNPIIVSADAVQAYSKKNTITALTLFHLNLINAQEFKILFNETKRSKKHTPNKLLPILSTNEYTSGLAPIFNPAIFEAFYPYFKTLSNQDVIEQLSVTNKKGQTPLFTYLILKSIAPYLVPTDTALNLLCHQDNEGDTLLHYSTLLKQLIPLFKKWDWNKDKLSLIDAFSILNNEEFAPLHCDESMELFIPVLEELINKDNEKILKDGEMIKEDDLYSIYFLLAIKNHSGMTALHFGDTYKKLLPTLLKLKPELFFLLHTIKNSKGMTPLHYADIFKEMIEHTPESFFDLYGTRLFSMKDAEGKTPMHYADIFKEMIEHTPESFFNLYGTRLFSMKDAEGNTPLHYSYKIAKRVLTNWDYHDFVGLHSIQNNRGETVLHNHRNMAYVVGQPIFDFHSAALLSIKDKKGNTPLHDVQALSIAELALIKLSCNNLEKVVSIVNNDGLSVKQIIREKSALFRLLNSIITTTLEQSDPLEYNNSETALI